LQAACSSFVTYFMGLAHILRSVAGYTVPGPHPLARRAGLVVPEVPGPDGPHTRSFETTRGNSPGGRAVQLFFRR
jgi:hypothetical protein